MKSKNKDVIVVEEKTFFERHSKKIFMATGILTAVGIGCLLHNHQAEIAEHAARILKLERNLAVNSKAAVDALRNTISAYEYEIKELIFKRDNLDPNATQNIFMNIPKLNEEIELKTRLKEAAEKTLAEVLRVAEDK